MLSMSDDLQSTTLPLTQHFYTKDSLFLKAHFAVPPSPPTWCDTSYSAQQWSLLSMPQAQFPLTELDCSKLSHKIDENGE